MDILHELGLAGKRVAVVHHDDLGMLHAQNDAHRALPRFPTGSVMMPAAWAAEWAGDTVADLGVHITLTSEWQAPRYRPLTGGATLRDKWGYFWATVDQAWAHIRADEAETEMHAQIESALVHGIDVTHIDTHMGSVMRPDLAAIYARLAVQYRVPALLPTAAMLDQLHIPPEFVGQLKSMISASPMPQFNLVDGYGLPPEDRTRWFAATLSSLPPGLYHVIHHAALATPESQTLPDCPTRVADFDALSDPEVLSVLQGVELITYRQIRDTLRAARVL